ncbi:MAG: 5-oxoprolinase subunit PxpB [Candidatus Sericytochromatia bacterium]
MLAPTSLEPLGDAALRLAFGDRIDPAINDAVRAWARAIVQASLPGVIEVVPTYAALTVSYDPGATDHEAIAAAITALADAVAGQSAPAVVFHLPVCYGGAFGPDLAELAALHGLSEAEVIARHAAPAYRIYMLGFAPGFPYLGGLDPTIATPRLATPRPTVPAGAVGIAGGQTGVYPIETPGGWRLIGRTPVRLFAPERPRPILLEPGALIRFEPVTPEAFDRIAALEAEGTYVVRRTAHEEA